MLKKLFLVILSICLMTAMLNVNVYAVNGQSGIFEISGTNGEADGTYDSIEKAMDAYLNTNGATCQMKLLDDATINIENEALPVGIGIQGGGSILDLGGHTLTVTGTGFAILTSGAGLPITVKNGKIVLNGSNLIGIVNGDNELLLENIEIILGNEAGTDIIGVQNGFDSSGHLSKTVIKNSQIDIAGNGNSSLSALEYDGYNLQIESGYFSSIPENYSNIVISSSSSEIKLDTVKSGIVVKSSDTTAIIVQNGRAYLYDTLQEAVDAAQKRGTDGKATITLVKQPENEKVMLPEGANITLKPMKNENIDTSKIQIIGPNNEDVEIDENGQLVIKPSEPDPNPPVPPIITYYDITATQSEHGTITLSTDRIYRYGDVDVTLTAEEGYEVKDLLINGKSVGAVSSYTIEDVTEDINVTAVFGETEEAKNDRIAKGVQNTTIKMYYKKGEIGKGWIKLRYKKSYGYKVDNYEIFRSAKKKINFGDKAWFVTKNNKTSGYYKNGKSVKKGTRYYYKMRGVREIAGETYYTQWSNVVMRTGR